MGDTKIEWTEKVWNIVTGCSPVGEACRNCYAKRMATRLAGRCGYPKDEPFRVTLHPDKLEEPLHWKKPCRIFVVSMGDLWHEDVPDGFIGKVFGAMALCPEHTFQILTKRPQRMLKWITELGEDHTSWYREWFLERGVWPSHHMELHRSSEIDYNDSCHREYAVEWTPYPESPLPNVWLGVSVWDQESADKNIPILLKTPAALRFVSYEPALGPVRLPWLGRQIRDDCMGQPQPIGVRKLTVVPGIDWLVCGGESGPGARPAHPDWFRSIRDQCAAAGVPWFFKQWGEWRPTPRTGAPDGVQLNLNGQWATAAQLLSDGRAFTAGWTRETGCRHMEHVGKRAAGSLLDGQEYKQFPGQVLNRACPDCGGPLYVGGVGDFRERDVCTNHHWCPKCGKAA